MHTPAKMVTFCTCLAFSFGICVGAVWGRAETIKAYGTTHTKIFK